MLLLLCGDIESLPGSVRHNSRRDSSLLTCRGLKLFHQNVRGLHAKLNLITVFLRVMDIDFLTLSETHTNNTSNLEIFSIMGYHYIGNSRTTGTGGGVGLYISDKHGFVRRKDLELTEIESIWIEIRIKKPKNILFVRHIDLWIRHYISQTTLQIYLVVCCQRLAKKTLKLSSWVTRTVTISATLIIVK